MLDHSLPLQSGYVFRSLGILGAQRGFGWRTAQATGPRHNAGAPDEDTVDGWTFHRTPHPARARLRLPGGQEIAEMRALSRRLDSVIAATRPDIVHAHSPLLAGYPALWAARRAGLPMVYELRGLWEDAAVDLGHTREGSARYRLTRALETRLMRRADAVVTLCQAMAREIAARGIPAAKLAIVPNAVDPARLEAARAPDPALAAALGLAGRTVLGFIGSFYQYEGLDLLLDALPAIRAARPDIAVLLVGGGPMEAALRARSAALGDAVRFAGRVPHDHVPRYYDLLDFLVLPRKRMRLTELVTPLKPLEAMAEGRLVIASDVGGHRELIADGKTGFLFPADDAAALAARVLAALGAGAAHEAIRAAARRFVTEERVWPVSAGAYRPLYARLLAARSPSPAPAGEGPG